MEILDKLKDAVQNGKERAILDTVMGMFGGDIKDIKPENPVASFIETNMTQLFTPHERHKGEFDLMASIVAKLLTAEANEDSTYSTKKLLVFYEAFRVWFKEQQKEV